MDCRHKSNKEHKNDYKEVERNKKSKLGGKRRDNMETRVAVISIIVENPEATEQLNQYLHEAGKYIIGRMGIPYRAKGIHIISIAIDAPQDIISALSGKIGRLKGVSAKTAYSNVITKSEEMSC